MNTANGFGFGHAGLQRPQEEERILGITYERARAMVPRLLGKATAADVQTLGDGYFVAQADRATKVTVRLGRSGADTRFLVRVEPSFELGSRMSIPVALVMLAGAVLGAVRHLAPAVPAMLGGMPILFGVAMLCIGVAMARRRQKQTLDRDLLAHGIFRSFEDAVAEQGVASHYRVAPGADATVADDDDPPEVDVEGPAAARGLR